MPFQVLSQYSLRPEDPKGGTIKICSAAVGTRQLGRLLDCLVPAAALQIFMVPSQVCTQNGLRLLSAPSARGCAPQGLVRGVSSISGITFDRRRVADALRGLVGATPL